MGGIGGFLNGEQASWGEVVSGLPVTGNWFGRQVILLSSGKQYIWNGTAWVTGVAAADIIGTLTTANFATTLRPPEVVGVLPATGNYLGRMVFLTTDEKLYKHAGSPANAAGFKKDVDGADLIASSIIAGKFAAGAIAADDLAAESFVASKALISDSTNVYPDYDMDDPAYYSTPNGASYTFPELVVDTLGANSLTMPANAALQTVVSK